jgi:hypothetical protein
MFAQAHDHILNAPHDAPGTAPNDAKRHEKTTELLGKERSGAATARLAVNCSTTFLAFMVMVTTSTTEVVTVLLPYRDRCRAKQRTATKHPSSLASPPAALGGPDQETKAEG